MSTVVWCVRKVLLSGFVALNAANAITAMDSNAQTTLSTPIKAETKGWRISLSREWDVLGPFPIHAQHFLSPSFPVKLTAPIDLNATWPSSYADGGTVGWTKVNSQEDGTLEVSFPDVRWGSLRATEGWAALQHHSVLRTTLTLYPPSSFAEEAPECPRIQVNLIQGSFFAIRPASVEDTAPVGFTPEWHAGNIYAMGRAPPNVVQLPSVPSMRAPTTYELFVSGDYEIRLFGDPLATHGDQIPKLSINLTVGIENAVPRTHEQVIHDASHDIVCDFVGGWAFGEAVGIGLRSLSNWWTVNSVRASDTVADHIELSLLQETRIAPSQTRIIPVRIKQTRPITLKALELTLALQSEGLTATVRNVIPVQQHSQWTSSNIPPGGIKASYFYGTSLPTGFLVKPPLEPNHGAPLPPVLALHGAGVDIFQSDFWLKALPRQRYSWVIAPTGRTEWGLDWHGPSAQDAWGTVEALYTILNNREEWREWRLASGSKVLLLGHSNGGQGAWYLAARYPDKVVGIVPAAGYIKSQSYVSWIQSRSAHYIDPSIRAILDSSLTPDDNDLFLSNLIDRPILAIHGGNDDNVPVWHTREAVSVLKTWNPRANVTLREDPGEPHWYETVFANDQVESFVSAVLDNGIITANSLSFTLTVAIPSDSGSLHGWSIHSLHIPGRLARLAVEIVDGAIHVQTVNVQAFSIHLGSLPDEARNMPFRIDDQTLELDEASWELPDFSLALSLEGSLWVPYGLSEISKVPPTGRIVNVLTSASPITIVVPSRASSSELSAALRVAHNLNVYHKLDADIIDDEEAMQRTKDGSFGPGNVVILGKKKFGHFATSLLSSGGTPFRIRDNVLELRGQSLLESSLAALFLHTHPSHPSSLALFVYGADSEGLERALRLFPIRTGVTVPDWIIVGSQADKRGSGGVEGAGVWGNDWSWNEAMSAF